MNTGERIRRKRKEKGMSQGVLGSKLGLSTSTISQYERGELLPNPWTLVNIASVLECSLEDIAPSDVVEKAELEINTVKHVKIRSGSTKERLPQRLLDKMHKYIMDHPAIDNVLRSKYGIYLCPDELFYDDNTLEKDILELLSLLGNIDHISRQQSIKGTEDMQQLLESFQSLNNEGRVRAIEFVEDLTQIERYKMQ